MFKIISKIAMIPIPVFIACHLIKEKKGIDKYCFYTKYIKKLRDDK